MFRKEHSSVSSTTRNSASHDADEEPGAPGRTVRFGKLPGKPPHNQKGGNNKDNNKKDNAACLDVPLRKSDVRELRQRVEAFFMATIEPATSSSDEKASNDNDQQQQPNDITTTSSLALMTQTLDAIFVVGSIASRNLQHAELGKLVLYVRTPDRDNTQHKNKSKARAGTQDSQNAILRWPYMAPQVIWIQQPPIPGSLSPEVALPTVALLSVLPPPCGSVATIRVPSAVSHNLCRGAHLMRAGIFELPESVQITTNAGHPNTPRALTAQAKQPARVVVLATGNRHYPQQPFAVGVVEPRVQTLADVGPNTSGIGVTIWTCYGDDLWVEQALALELERSLQKNHNKKQTNDEDGSLEDVTSPWGGAPYNQGHYGNTGFLEGKRVVPLGQRGCEKTCEGDCDEEGEEVPELARDKGEGEQITGTTTTTSGEEESSDTPSPDGTAESVPGSCAAVTPAPHAVPSKADGDKDHTQSNDPETTTCSNGIDTMEPTNETQQEKEKQLSPDDVLHHAVCKALLTSVQNKDLPMAVANFYASHVLPSRPANTTINLKQTTYKKFGVYLQEQVQRGMVTLGANGGKDPQGYLATVNKRHEDLIDFKRQHQEEVQASQQSAASLQPLKLVLVNLYVVPNHFNALLRLDQDLVQANNATSPERRGTGMLTGPEARKLLDSYLEREQLIDAVNTEMAQVDGPLFDALYKKKKLQGDAAVDNNMLKVSRKDLSEAWLAAMNDAYGLVEMPGSKVRTLGKGQPPKVQIEVSMRQSKKFVTKIRGMEAYGINGAALGNDVGRRFATQATVKTDPEKGAALKKGCVELVFGGNLADELEALLSGDESLCSHGGVKNSDYRLPKNSIEVVLRKGVPARKRTKKSR